MISACEKDRDPERALAPFETTQTQGLEPNLITYLGLISACDKASEQFCAFDVFQAMPCQGVGRPNHLQRGHQRVREGKSDRLQRLDQRLREGQPPGRLAAKQHLREGQPPGR